MTAIQRGLGYPGRKGLLAKWINRYIRWYNEKRLKRSLGGGMSPLQYRRSLGFVA